MPGQKITKADRKRIPPKFICMICSLLLNSPMQTSCGHLLCYFCLETIRRYEEGHTVCWSGENVAAWNNTSSSPCCPLDGTDLTSNVFPDAFTKRELMMLVLHCPNRGCDWSGTNKDLQADHSGNCDHALINCVHDPMCKKEVKRCQLSQHLEQECEYRKVKCPYCKNEMKFILLKEHLKQCPKALLTCKYCTKNDIPREKMVKHESVDCEEIPKPCPFKNVGCEYTEVPRRKDLREHFSDAITSHVKLLLEFFWKLFGQVTDLEKKVESTGAMQSDIQDLKDSNSFLSDKVENLWISSSKTSSDLLGRVAALESGNDQGTSEFILTEIRKLQSTLREVQRNYEKVVEKNTNLEREVLEKNATIDRLRTKVEHLDGSLALNTVKLTDIEMSMGTRGTPSYNGTLLWRLDNFNRKRQDAVSGVQTAIYSPHFYSSQFGYKMCARIYMNGDGFGKDSHLSLFFVVMRGEYDALLSWPFQKKITMMLLDQTTGDHMVDSFRSDVQSSSFQRPKTEMNIASGSPLFMPLNALKNGTYVKDDIMFIKIVVD